MDIIIAGFPTDGVNGRSALTTIHLSWCKAQGTYMYLRLPQPTRFSNTVAAHPLSSSTSPSDLNPSPS